MTTTPTTFDASPFVRSHLRDPRGRGSWAFATSPDADLDNVLFTPSMTYTEARRFAAAVNALAATPAAVLYVLP